MATTINRSTLGSLNIEVGESPSLLLQVFDRISLPTFVIDANHEICHWNRALEVLTGLNREAMIGTKDQWMPFYSSPRPCLADLIVEGGEDKEVQRYYTNKYTYSELITDAFEAEDFFPECGDNGEWLHFTAAALHDDDGHLIGAIETLAKISDRKRAEFELIESEQSYREQSISDNLTRLYNSRHFHHELDQALENSKRYNHVFSLCFLDLDHFKQINDTHGHFFGDKVLEAFGMLVRSSLRTLDSAYRYGGEEFTILLPSTPAEGAAVFAERLRESLANHAFSLDNGEKFSATVSIGITSYSTNDDSKSMLQRADEALYVAKQNGRNQVGIL